eukprot:TRINITY_DN14732_c0_g1_i4.p1 TRINITY_DN14732_c0_g1~~TRINITY_DN14732_c0_g1_i4.p1  ORF type:complete len:499 (-),score=94.76 TRINITY_DN14732_c0_g1_i4:72-1568(-)
MSAESIANSSKGPDQPKIETFLTTEGKVDVGLIASRSFADPPDVVFLLCDSNMNSGSSHYQNYIISQSLANASPRISCAPMRCERLRPVRERLEKSSVIDVLELVVRFKGNPTSFKAFYNNFMKWLIDSDNTVKIFDKTKGANNESEGIDAKTIKNISFLQYLKDLSTVCREICKRFVGTSPGLEDYGKFWDEYLRVMMELEFCFAPLADALRAVSDELLEGTMCRFSICRLIKAVFIRDCYCLLEDKLRPALRGKLKTLLRHVAYSKLFEAAKSEKEESIKIVYEENKEELVPVRVRNEIQIAYMCLQGLIDVDVNELNVHYINTANYLNRLSNPRRLQEIKNQITECFKEVNKEISELGYDLMNELLSLCRTLVPVPFLEGVNDHVKNIKTEKFKQAIREVYEEMEEDSTEDIELYEELTCLVGAVLAEFDEEPKEETIKRVMAALERKRPEVLGEFEMLDQYESLMALADSSIVARNEEMNLVLSPDADQLYAQL